MIAKLIAKLLSARFWLALGFGLTACIGFLKGILPVEAFTPILASILTFYFTRTRPKENPLNPQK